MVDLAIVTDLAGQPGGPFTAEGVKSAGDGIRAFCGWHIAPSVTETITIDSYGGPILMLPTLYLTAVTEVVDVSGDTPTVLTGWRKSRAGMLSLPQGWPCGFESVEVTFTHGYAACPAELFPVIAERTQRKVQQESLGSRSVSYATEDAEVMSSVVARYKLPPRP